MRAAAMYLLVLLLGLGIGVWGATYYLEQSREEAEAGGAGEEEVSADEGVSMRIATIFDSGERYHIEVRYPQFGIEAVDSVIRERVERSVNEFRDGVAEIDDVPEMPRFEYLATFDAVYAGPDFASILLYISRYMGGAHPGAELVGLNFEMPAGRELTLSDALALTGMSLSEVADVSRAELAGTLGESFFPEGAAPTPLNYGTFTVDADTVTFYFQEYQVAPYAAGPQKVSLPRAR